MSHSRYHTTRVRVRYVETDQMGVVYHANYLVYYEIGRTEYLRSLGRAYSDLEREGIRLTVVEASARYRAPARYDDLVEIRTRLAGLRGVRVRFAYELWCADRLLSTGETVLACIDREGRPRRLPGPVRAALVAHE